MSDHNHEDPLDSILNESNEATEDNASTNTPDLSSGLIDTLTKNKLFQLFQNFIHSQENTSFFFKKHKFKKYEAQNAEILRNI